IANAAVIYNPTISFYKDGKYSATLTMQRAEINLDNYNVIGFGNCVVKTADGQVLKTTDIHYDSKNNKVYSNKGVQIQRASEFLEGASFEADTSLKNIVIYKQSIVINDAGNNSI
ncbi:MAG: LPS export ABC transporter periplasmic protein LptC, partial [Elusimicrobiota bacterium]|nr:LPS export ABC transporter periplasmic protein LptC [Elusimicrobiota bacterium]